MTLRDKLAHLRKSAFAIARKHGATYSQATRVALRTTKTAKRLKKGKRLLSGKYTPAEKRKIARAMSRALKNVGI